MKKIVTILLMGLMFSTPGFAAEAEIVTKIKNMIFTSDGRYGGCGVQLYVNPRMSLSSCGDNWVSFSCSGTFASKSDAKGMFEMAQLAFLLDKEVNIAFHDTKIENGGHCVSTYIAILNQTYSCC